jgi:hypothetical protein
VSLPVSLVANVERPSRVHWKCLANLWRSEPGRQKGYEAVLIDEPLGKGPRGK